MSVNQDCNSAPAPVHGVVVFEPAAFRALYPQFVNPPTTDAMLQGYFSLATIILNNTCGSLVCDAVTRERLLNLLVAHIATLFIVSPQGGAMIGRITSATEGSVSIRSEYAANVSASMAWFIQSQYGALYWQLTAAFRSFRYVPPPSCCGPAGPYAGRRGY